MCFSYVYDYKIDLVFQMYLYLILYTYKLHSFHQYNNLYIDSNLFYMNLWQNQDCFYRKLFSIFVFILYTSYLLFYKIYNIMPHMLMFHLQSTKTT